MLSNECGLDIRVLTALCRGSIRQRASELHEPGYGPRWRPS